MEKPETKHTGASIMVGGKLIAPGCTRMIDETLIPHLAGPHVKVGAGKKTVPKATANSAPKVDEAKLAEILGHKVGEIEELVESLSVNELKALKAIEENTEKRGLLKLGGGPRKGVLEMLETLIALREEEATEK